MAEVEITDVLLVCIEVSVALAGFSGIIATFQLSGAIAPRRVAIAGLSYIVQASLLTAVAAFLPLILMAFKATDAVVWSASHIFVAIGTSAFIYTYNKSVRGAVMSRSHRAQNAAIQGVCALAAIVNLLCSIDLAIEGGPGPYLATLVLGLAIAGFLFSRLLLVPLWRLVLEREE